jgi:outer membrane protein assembly factor BamB
LLLAGALTWCSAQVNVTTYHNDNARTGQNVAETLLTPANVSVSTFGKLFLLAVDGKVDAQPLIVSGASRNVIFVATEHASVYAFDADTGAKLWQVSLLKANEAPSDDRGCGQVLPEIGITSTPVIDRGAGLLFAVAMSKNGSGTYFQRLHALDLATGKEQLGGPVDIQATFPGIGEGSHNGTLVFDPKQYKARPGLLLLNGTIYIGWSSHCDIQPYTAWLMAYSEATLAQTAVLDMTPNGSEGSIWQSGAGLAADTSGNIFFLLANGDFDVSQANYGNAFMKISTASGGLAVADYFGMDNIAAENSSDADLGSGGALLLPDLVDSSGRSRHLAVGAGKDANIYVVDRDSLGHFNSASNNIYQELPKALASGEFGMPAYYNNTVYYGAVSDSIKAFPVTQAKLATVPSSHTAHIFGYPGTTPSISANGTSNGIVWAAENGDTAVLHAYDASNLASELYNSSLAPDSRDFFGQGNKFITPTIANGKVYVGTTNGVGVFGALGCTFKAAPLAEVPFRGGQESFTLSVAPANCTWKVTSDRDWIVPLTPDGAGSGNIKYRLYPNFGAKPRSGHLLISGQSFPVMQHGTADPITGPNQ